ncbi:MAG TPA: universal stress protein [Polyangiaceae bacterium]|nr:universal stress protein [Polyangiaceae bacterium]
MSMYPVMVVRAQGVTEKVLAATDLHRDESSVIRRAVALGHQLGTSVLAIHNLSSVKMAPSLCSPALAPFPSDPAFDMALEAATRAQATAALPTVMTNERSAVDAVIGEARARRVHMIVVGTSARTPRIQRGSMQTAPSPTIASKPAC